VQRSLQTQILTWLSTLATIAAAAKPNTDHALFAAVLLLGTVLANARLHLVARKGKLGPLVGAAIGAAIPWAFALLRTHAPLAGIAPTSMTAGALVVSAALPTIALLLHAIVAVRARMSMRIIRDLEDAEDLD
jgi:hypothetical protein